MIFDAFTIAVMLCSLAPAVLFCLNWRRYLLPPQAESLYLPAISVLIPARDDQDGIAAAVESVLASIGVAFDVIVVEDGSIDRTADIVETIAKKDARVRLERTQTRLNGMKKAASDRPPCFSYVDRAWTTQRKHLAARRLTRIVVTVRPN
jgi:cellulose synthase/poly-beta-1,6-N-acetylglucosamine synthase-like glycosyltransferase